MAYVTEKWIPKTNRRKDAFGFGDVLAVDDKPGALLIQATSTGNMSARIKKITNELHADAARWLRAGNRIEVWGWAKRVHKCKNGKTIMRWKLRTVALELHDVGEGCTCRMCAAVDLADAVLP